MSTPTEYKIGDLVEIKSGGPIMTIKNEKKISGKKVSGYYCQWFAGKKLEFGEFPTESLQTAERKTK